MASKDPVRWRGMLQVSMGIALTFLFLYMMAPFVLALFISAIIAIIAFPLYRSLARMMPRSLAALILTIGFGLCILLPAAGTFIVGAYQLSNWLKNIHLPEQNVLVTLMESPNWRYFEEKLTEYFPGGMDWVQQYGSKAAMGILERVSEFATGAISSIPGFLLAMTIIIISVFFFLVDGEKLLRFLLSISPLPPTKSIELYNSFELSCRGVVTGMVLSCMAQGALIFAFFLVTGVPHAALWGCTAVFMGMVPIVGVAPISLGGIVYLISTGSWVGVGVLVLGSMVIGTADNVVRSLVMKGHSEMHPLLALVSALGAVSWMGASGIFMGPIIAAVFVTFLKILSKELAPNRLE